MTSILTCAFLLLFQDTPPGTIRVQSHFVDQTEIQNIDWMEYLYYQKQRSGTLELDKFLPDSANTWYDLPENRYQPIVLITYEQAIDYCAWRSMVVSQKTGKKITYRLPTPDEWNTIAEELLRSGSKRAGTTATNNRMQPDSGQPILTSTENPKSRIQNLFDHVHEMTLEKGVAMGGDKDALSRTSRYDSADPYLGFRCVAEVEE